MLTFLRYATPNHLVGWLWSLAHTPHAHKHHLLARLLAHSRMPVRASGKTANEEKCIWPVCVRVRADEIKIIIIDTAPLNRPKDNIICAALLNFVPDIDCREKSNIVWLPNDSNSTNFYRVYCTNIGSFRDSIVWFPKFATEFWSTSQLNIIIQKITVLRSLGFYEAVQK